MHKLRLAIPLLLAAALAVGACSDSYQVAASVGDLEITHDELRAEAEAWGANADLMNQLGIASSPAEGVVPQTITNEILNLHIQGELARLVVAEEAESPDGVVQMEQIRAGIDRDFGTLFAGFPEGLRDAIYDDIAFLQFASFVGATPEPVDVYVSSRYGSVDANSLVQIPTGALPNPDPLVFGL